MEEFWKKDPELTFHQVKYYAEDKFGKSLKQLKRSVLKY
jgi:hypothetical protein